MTQLAQDFFPVGSAVVASGPGNIDFLVVADQTERLNLADPADLQVGDLVRQGGTGGPIFRYLGPDPSVNSNWEQVTGIVEEPVVTPVRDGGLAAFDGTNGNRVKDSQAWLEVDSSNRRVLKWEQGGSTYAVELSELASIFVDSFEDSSWD